MQVKACVMENSDMLLNIDPFNKHAIINVDCSISAASFTSVLKPFNQLHPKTHKDVSAGNVWKSFAKEAKHLHHTSQSSNFAEMYIPKKMFLCLGDGTGAAAVVGYMVNIHKKTDDMRAVWRERTSVMCVCVCLNVCVYSSPAHVLMTATFLSVKVITIISGDVNPMHLPQ